jgi:hypothetical protein
MHTLMVVATGLLLLGMCLAIGRVAGGMARACLVFLPLWFIGAGINMYIGVTQAGYSVADEAPMFVVVFAIPAAIALALWRVLKR